MGQSFAISTKDRVLAVIVEDKVMFEAWISGLTKYLGDNIPLKKTRYAIVK